MSRYTLIEEREQYDDIISFTQTPCRGVQADEESDAYIYAVRRDPPAESIIRSHASAKRCAIIAFLCSYIVGISSIAALHYVQGSYLPAFFVAIVIVLHCCGWFCLCCIVEAG